MQSLYTLQSFQASMMNAEYVYSAVYSAVSDASMMNAKYVYYALYSAVCHASMMNAEWVCPD